MGGVRAEIALPLEHAGEGPAAVARAVEEASLALGVAHLLDRRTESLSGGELQRVALAAAISTRPRLLLLDEPTAQLDPVAGDELIWLLRRLNEEWGTTVLLAEHRLERCLGAADRVIALEDGRLIGDSDPEGFLNWAAEGRRESFVTPVARMFAAAALAPLPTSVKAARAGLRARGLLPEASLAREAAAEPVRRRRRGQTPDAALELRGVWCELKDGPAILRGVDLAIRAGERVVLMGRNGAGKSTLLRHAKGLDEPTRGSVKAAGWVALLMQNPGDYLVHDHVEDEAGPGALAAAGLTGREAVNPRDLSGGERQRLALELVLAGGDPAAVLLDEPTRGMDAVRKRGLAERLCGLAGAGAAVLVATHDSAFAAEFADRVVLLGGGRVLADGSPAEVLAGGWYFATEVARVLDGADGALTPDAGAEVLRAGRRSGGGMTWELAALLVLGLAIAAGFAWYERSRPPANVLAVVAALAALAVIGRIAFAAFPNVKPTTDIVLIAGYGLGGPPGFAVGAVTALASNFFLSQGPWTPWQMIGWGGVGVFGAVLAKLMRGREPSRLMLAGVCALAGAAFGILMDFYQWTLAAEQSIPSYLAIAGTSLPYNLAHVIGNFVFALLIGKPLLNALRRIRSRFEARWESAPAIAPTLLVVAALGGAVLVPSLAVSKDSDTALSGDPATDALTWLRAAQNDDGGFGSDEGKKSNQLFSAWAALALAASGTNPASTTVDGDHDLLEYIEDDVKKLDDTTDLARTILIVEASGLKADKFGKENLIKDLLKDRRSDGSYEGQVAVTAFGMLAQKAAGEQSGLKASARWLLDQQNEDDGAWALRAEGEGDVDITASVAQALEAAGDLNKDTEDLIIDFFKKAQNSDGGFGQSDGDSSNSQSTSFAVQALQAMGETPADFGGKDDPIKYLEDQQLKDGSVKYGGGSNQTPVWVTAQAILAFKTADFPLTELAKPVDYTDNGKNNTSSNNQNNDILTDDNSKVKTPKTPDAPSSSPSVTNIDPGPSLGPPEAPQLQAAEDSQARGLAPAGAGGGPAADQLRRDRPRAQASERARQGGRAPPPRPHPRQPGPRPP